MMLEQSIRPNQVVYTLDKGESWVDFQLDFLIQSRPGWALETAIRVKNGTSQLVLDLSGLATAESIDAKSQYLPELGKSRLTAILEAYDKAIDALFSRSQILLEPGHVFFDPSTGQVRLMILPVNRQGGSNSLEALIRSIAGAYHMDQESLDSFLMLVQSKSPAMAGINLTGEQQPLHALQTDERGKSECQPVPGRQSRTFSWSRLYLVVAHLVLPILWVLIQVPPYGDNQWSSGFVIPEPFRSWGYLILGGSAITLLLLDLYVSGIWHQMLVHATRKGTAKKVPSAPAQASAAGASDQTELIQVQQSAYRLGLLSLGMPGTPQEMEGLRAYILVDEFLVGRDDAICDLPLPTASVGRRHARITRREGSFFITDLGSKNGTSLDGRRLNKLETYLLPDRCRIEFADQAFYFAAD